MNLRQNPNLSNPSKVDPILQMNLKNANVSQQSISQPSASALNSSSPQNHSSVSQIEEQVSIADAYQQLNSTKIKRFDSTNQSTRSQKAANQLKAVQNKNMNQTTSNFGLNRGQGFQRVQLQGLNQNINSNYNSHHNSMYQTIKDQSDGARSLHQNQNLQNSMLETYSSSHSSSQLRVKMLKRYSLKSKASNVLLRIGFPQKKYKIQEDLRKIKKEIGAKMDDENQEFFDLLNATSQSFFEQLNDSVANQTFFAGGNRKISQRLQINEYGSADEGAEGDYNELHLMNEGKRQSYGVGNSRPATELKGRTSMLCPPPQLSQIIIGKSQKDKSQEVRSRQEEVEENSQQWDFNNLPTRGTSTNVYYSRNNNTNLSFLNPPLSSNQQNGNGLQNNRPQTSQVDANQASLNDMSSFINQKLQSQAGLDGQKLSKVQINTATASTKLTFNTNTGVTTMSRPATKLKDASRNQLFSQKMMNKTTKDFRKYANTTLESSQNEKSPNKSNKSQAYQSKNKDLSKQGTSHNDYSDFQPLDTRVRSYSNERKAFLNSTINSEQPLNGLDSSSIFLLQQIDRKPQNNRASFKRSRHEALQYYGLNHQLSTIELQFEAIRYALSGSDNLLRIKFLIVQSYEIICYPQISLEMRKTSLIDTWSKLIAEIKQSDELSTAFDLLFHTQKALGDIYMDFKDLTEAVRVFKSLKILCEDFQRYQEKMFIYQQIGYVYRIMKDNESAVKQFKKQLQLAWQEGDTQMEVNAYDNLSLEYFYLGELSKANYYNDRIMRGKTENNKSIVKKVSCNLLVSRREHRHNLELRKAGEKQKVAIEHQRLPSPSAINKGTQFSKAINLLPYYTESQALGIKEEEEDDEASLGSTTKKKISKAKSQERKFTQKELLHLNKPPPYEYLKPQKDQKLLSSKSYFGVGASRNGGNALGGSSSTNQGYEVNGVYRQEDPVDYKPFDEDRFRDIVSYALQKKETSHTTDDKRNLSHLSVHRTAPLNVMHPHKMIDSLKRIVEGYVARLVQLAVQDKLLKQKDSASKKDQLLSTQQSQY